jgi:hypothetical protein
MNTIALRTEMDPNKGWSCANYKREPARVKACQEDLQDYQKIMEVKTHIYQACSLLFDPRPFNCTALGVVTSTRIRFLHIHRRVVGK